MANTLMLTLVVLVILFVAAAVRSEIEKYSESVEQTRAAAQR